MDTRQKIKVMIAMRAMTITSVAKEMAKRTGKDYTFKSLTGKLQRGTLSLDEFYLISDILDYRLEIIDKRDNKTLF